MSEYQKHYLTLQHSPSASDWLKGSGIMVALSAAYCTALILLFIIVELRE